jgi:hypothetical protein
MAFDNGGNGKKKSARLTKVEQAFIIQRLAEFCTSASIMTDLNRIYHKKVSGTSAIDYYKYNSPWMEMVVEKRVKWLDEIENEIPLSHKKIRLQRYSELYDEALKPRLTRIYQFMGEVIEEIHENYPGEARMCLDSIRKEMQPMEAARSGGQGDQNYRTEKGDINIISGDYIKELQKQDTDKLKARKDALLAKLSDRFKSIQVDTGATDNS